MEPIISVRDLYKIFKIGDTEVYALNGLNFDIYQGEFIAIVGTSGSGKSTCLNMLAGLEKPSKGSITITGESIEKMNEKQLVAFRRMHVGFIFQSYNLIPFLNAMENVAMPLMFRGVSKEERNKKALEYLELMNIGKEANRSQPDVRRTAAKSGYCQGLGDRSGDYFCGRTHRKPGFPYHRRGFGLDAKYR